MSGIGINPNSGVVQMTGTVTGSSVPKQASPWTKFDDVWMRHFDIGSCISIVVQGMAVLDILFAYPDRPGGILLDCATIMWALHVFAALVTLYRLRTICAHFINRDMTIANAMTDTTTAPDTLYKSPNRGGSEAQ